MILQHLLVPNLGRLHLHPARCPQLLRIQAHHLQNPALGALMVKEALELAEVTLQSRPLSHGVVAFGTMTLERSRHQD